MASVSENIEDAILNAVRMRIAELMEKEAASAKSRVLTQLAREMDQLALQVLSYYDVARNGQHVTITVRKPEALAPKSPGEQG